VNEEALLTGQLLYNPEFLLNQVFLSRENLSIRYNLEVGVGFQNTMAWGFRNISYQIGYKSIKEQGKNGNMLMMRLILRR